MNFGTVSTGGGAFGVSRESKEGFQCWLKITVKMNGHSSAHAPFGGPNDGTTSLALNSGTIKSECVCEKDKDNGATHDYPGAVMGLGGSFNYEWSIWYGPKCGGRFCWPTPWQVEDPDEDEPPCPCFGGCGPFSFELGKNIKSGSSSGRMRRALAKEAKKQMLAAIQKAPCLRNEDCEGNR